jgi:hypothetical protein
MQQPRLAASVRDNPKLQAALSAEQSAESEHKKTALTEARAGQMHLLTRNIQRILEDFVRLP